MMHRWTAGCVRIDITPPTGSLMACFPVGLEREPRRATGAHDPLTCTVLVLDDGEEAIAICALDLGAIRRVDVARIRTFVEMSVPELSGGRVLLAASHTHSGAETFYLFGNIPEDPWVQEIDCRIGEAVIAAWHAREPVTLHWATAELEACHNRRVLDEDGQARMVMEYAEGETTGVTDPTVSVLRINKKGGMPLAMLFHYTAHALAVGPENTLYTADYPGVARGVVEAAFPGALSLFMNGAAGNIHPHMCMRADFSAMVKVGAQLGDAVVRTASEARPLKADALSLTSETLKFQNRVDPSLSVDVEVSAVGVGELLLGFLPGEVFVEFQLQFREACQPHPAVLVGYANGWPGYVPTRAAYRQGGYGVDVCTIDPAGLSRTALPPGAGEEMLDVLMNQAQAMRNPS